MTFLLSFITGNDLDSTCLKKNQGLNQGLQREKSGATMAYVSIFSRCGLQIWALGYLLRCVLVNGVAKINVKCPMKNAKGRYSILSKWILPLHCLDFNAKHGYAGSLLPQLTIHRVVIMFCKFLRVLKD
jgi:hypothetical protein